MFFKFVFIVYSYPLKVAVTNNIDINIKVNYLI